MKEEKYWDARYSKRKIPFLSRGTSGKGSKGLMRTWKWGIIKKYLPEIDHVVDFGCGDLSFWEGNPCLDYTGIDISMKVLIKNAKRTARTYIHWTPKCPIIKEPKKPIVFCLDVLFHILNDDDFIVTLTQLCTLSNKWIFISTWENNPMFPKVTDEHHQYYRELERFYYIFDDYGFKLEKIHPYSDGINAMYVFKKI